MSDSFEQLQTTLKVQGYSLTNARRMVFNALRGQEPQTMGELGASLNGKADRASLYRTIALFEKLGIVQRLHIGWKYKLELSDTFSHHHHHLSCLKCGRVIAIKEHTELEERINRLATSHNFQPIDHQLEIRGTCSSCQKKMTPVIKPGSLEASHFLF